MARHEGESTTSKWHNTMSMPHAIILKWQSIMEAGAHEKAGHHAHIADGHHLRLPTTQRKRQGPCAQHGIRRAVRKSGDSVSIALPVAELRSYRRKLGRLHRYAPAQVGSWCQRRQFRTNDSEFFCCEQAQSSAHRLLPAFASMKNEFNPLSASPGSLEGSNLETSCDSLFADQTRERSSGARIHD